LPWFAFFFLRPRLLRALLAMCALLRLVAATAAWRRTDGRRADERRPLRRCTPLHNVPYNPMN
jgi:hypothetical protein